MRAFVPFSVFYREQELRLDSLGVAVPAKADVL